MEKSIEERLASLESKINILMKDKEKKDRKKAEKEYEKKNSSCYICRQRFPMGRNGLYGGYMSCKKCKVRYCDNSRCTGTHKNCDGKLERSGSRDIYD